MRAIKIGVKNAEAIEAALLAVNGKAVDHTYTTFQEIKTRAEWAEKEVVDLVGSKAHAVGAKVWCTSGGRVANAYKYNRVATSVQIERRATGWFLTSVGRTEVCKEGGGLTIYLTAKQDALAVALFRKSYRVAT